MNLSTIDQYRQMIKHEELEKYPELQSKSIVEHYTECAAMAINAMKIIDHLEKFRDQMPGPIIEASEKIINIQVEKIKYYHSMRLGISLSWEIAATTNNRKTVQ